MTLVSKRLHRAAAVLALAGAACGVEPVEEAPVVRPVKTFEFGGTGFAGRVAYSGVVRASRQADMGFEVPGRIIDFPVAEGQRVESGTLLAQLDPRDFEAQRDARRAQRNAAEADYARYQELYAADAVSLQELEVRRRNFEVADANYRTAEKGVADTYLRAPFAGRVARKLVEDFVNVPAKQVVLILQDDSKLEVVVNVPEGDALRGARYLMNANEMALLNPAVELSSLPDRRFPARLKEFATTADPVTRTFAATFSFESPTDATLRPGMTARVTLSPEARVLTGRSSIPASAVLGDEQGAAYVWLIERSNMTVSRAPIEVGAVFGDEIELVGGLSLGDLIAVSGVHNLRSGMQVRSLPPPPSE